MSQSEPDAISDALERLEWGDERARRASRALRLTRRSALTGGAAGLVAALLDACGSASGNGTTTIQAPANPVPAIFGVKGNYRFTFVNHARANAFFVPTVNGIQDACRLLNCSYEWTGSTSSSVQQMASAINTAISARVDGIATSLISPLLAEPVDAAIRARIPVIAYNADAPGTRRLAYIGQDPRQSGREMGRRIRELLPGGGRIAVFIGVPGSTGVQPRLDGIREALAGTRLHVTSPAAGAGETQEQVATDAFISAHRRRFRGYFGVDAGSTAGLALAIQKYGLTGKVVGGGFDLTPSTETLLAQGVIQFAIDQQPYLQGFLATLELFLYRATDGLIGPADVDTGMKFLDRHTVGPYATTSSRYEGTGTSAGIQRG
ncbi:MAG TPA: substrate-binding domain-containing protein [Solirubrobacteraceae bacterium]|nr:substrate-binding domain-containing protein [Solirubrobacteraceae bacterium]